MNKTLNKDVYADMGEIMTNFDHTIVPNAEEALKKNKVFGVYPAWNFRGIVWYEDGIFYCEIWQYGNHVNTIEGNDLSEIMETASQYYGEG